MSSRHKFACHIALLSLALLYAASISLAQVAISNPTSGQTVRGMVNIIATKTDSAHGWVSFKIEGPQQSGDFTAAVVEPFRLVWDTNSAAEDGKPRFPDGEYTITAVGHLPSGQMVGQESVRVTLQNDIETDLRPTSIELAADYKRGRELTAQARGRARTKLIEHDDFHAKIAGLYTGMMEAQWRERAMSNSAGGTAIVRFYFDKGYTSLQGSRPANLPRVGDIFTLNVNPKATVSVRRKGDQMFELGSLDLQLPDQPVRQGSTWRSPMYVVPLLGADRRRVTANHRLDGFQWVEGHKCIRIVSEYSENDVSLTVRMGPSVAPTAAMDMGMMEMPDMAFFGPPELAAPFPGDMAPEVAGATPAATVSVAAPPTTTVTSSYKGTRVSYFAYELAQFLRSEDFISHKLTIDSTQFGGGAQRGGYMFGDPMMDMYGPGGVMEDLLAGDSAERPWGAPPGQPMPQVEVKKDFEAEAQVSVIINRR